MNPAAYRRAMGVLASLACGGCTSDKAVLELNFDDGAVSATDEGFTMTSGGTGDTTSGGTGGATVGGIGGSSASGGISGTTSGGTGGGTTGGGTGGMTSGGTGGTTSGGTGGTTSGGGTGGTAASGGTGGTLPVPTDVACPCAEGDFTAPEEVTQYDDGIAWFSPTLSADLLTLYFTGHNGLVESIYTATRPDRCSLFGPPVPVDSINTAGSNGTPALSSDGLELYYYSDRAGSVGGRDIWRSTRDSVDAEFGTAENLLDLNTTDTDHLARVTWDGLSLYFSSTRPGGGVEDIFVATRATLGDPFTNPTRVDELNDVENDSGATLTPDGLTVYFASNRDGNWDLFMATRPDTSAPFMAPTALDILNTEESELDPAPTEDHQELFFTSFRTGTARIWRSVRACQ